MKIDLICIDMFQTLVDVNTRIPFIWGRILQEKYTKELGEQCANLVSSKAISRFHDTGCRSDEFNTIKELFRPCFYEIAAETGLDFHPEAALEVFLSEHAHSALYEDTEQFFRQISERIPICLVSDADRIMVEPLVKQFQFSKVFISEDIGAYKNDKKGRMFEKVLKHYQIEPESVLHIGDSTSDIIGANRAGIKSCWINRDRLTWNHEIKPDMTIHSLLEIADFINEVSA